MATLLSKKEYAIHYRNLQQCRKHGLKITKIHRAIEFVQSACMKPFILFNTEKRKKATNAFETTHIKITNLGKLLQNLRKIRNIKLVSSFDKAFGANFYISKPNFYDRVIFDFL